MPDTDGYERPGRVLPGSLGVTEATGVDASVAASAVEGNPTDRVRALRTQRLAEFMFAGFALAIGIFVLIGANSIRATGAGVQVGPKVFPYLVSGILIVSAFMVLIDIWRGHLGPREDAEDADSTAKTDWLTLTKLTAFVVAHLALINAIGWPLAAALLFGGVA